MRRVIIESPYAGEVERNKIYLRDAVLDCLSRGESPYASHGFFTSFLDDNNPAERKTGIDAGLAWSKAAELVVLYLDFGMSSGMKYALARHVQAARPIEARLLTREHFLTFDYKNYKGELARRRARVKSFYWGRTKWHPKDQILMKAHCLDRNEERNFAVSDMDIIQSGYML